MERTSPTQRQIKAAATKKKLKDAAISLFAKYGYDKVTVESIAAAAGTSKGAFYSHFQAKDDILLEGYREVDVVSAGFPEKLQDEEDIFEQLIGFMKMLTDYVMHEWGVDLMRVIYVSQINGNGNGYKMLIDENRPIYKFIKDKVAQGQAQGVFRQDLSSVYIAKMLIRILRSFIYDWCMYDGTFDLTHETQRQYRLVYDMIKSR